MAKYEEIEQKIIPFATFDPEDIKEVDINEVIDQKDLEYFAEGILSRVYKIKGTNWLVKEGKWDLDIELFKGVKLPASAQVTESVLRIFDYSFLPQKEEVSRQYADYLKFTEYMGYFDDEDQYYHPNRSEIFRKQRFIRKTLLGHREAIERIYKFKLDDKIDKVLRSHLRYHNFLPKEYLLYGKALHSAADGKNTYYIFQKFIEGKSMRDTEVDSLDEDQSSKLVVFMYLIFMMHLYEGLLPDTRPKYIHETPDWIRSTENLVVCDDDVKFVDTRWLWETGSNFIKRGGLIPEIALRANKININQILSNV